MKKFNNIAQGVRQMNRKPYARAKIVPAEELYLLEFSRTLRAEQEKSITIIVSVGNFWF